MNHNKNDIHLSPLDVPTGVRQQNFEQQSQQLQQKLEEQQEHLKTIHNYYSDLPIALGSRFENLDLDRVYQSTDAALVDPRTQNLVIDFGKDCAFVAKDVGINPEDNLEALLGPVTGLGARPRDLRTRWICIFSPHCQPDLIEIIGKRYGLSPRLKTMLLSKSPDMSNITPSTYSSSRLRRAQERLREGVEWAREGMGKARRSMENRINPYGVNGVATGLSNITSPKTPETTIAIPMTPSTQALPAPKRNTGFMDLVAKVWHWHAVEWGGRFICIGYNSLYNIPQICQESTLTDDKGLPIVGSANNQSSNIYGFAFDSHDNNNNSEDNDDQIDPVGRNNYPEGRRLWTWLILCDDGTVISLHEPHQFRTTPTALDYSSQIAITRRNLRVILRSLSASSVACGKTEDERMKGGIGALEQLPFRKQVSGTEIQDSGPSLLFCYLFDDWHASWSLAIDRQHPYAKRLKKIRSELVRDPKLKHGDDLLHLAGQLAVLKRMYETYKLIIDRILYRQENSLYMAQGGGKVVYIGNDNQYNSHSQQLGSASSSGASDKFVPVHPPPGYPQPRDAPGVQRSDTMESNQIGDPTILGVPLSPLAVTRLERMRDRITLYALAEIQDCLDEKDGLVHMLFNLIAFRQTDAVEKLSRVAILLAKATILFMPITLVTGFFSMQISDMQGKYTETDFWGSTGVVMFLTLLVLFTLGKYTGTAETTWVWRAVKQVWFGWIYKGKKKETKRN